MGEDISKTTVMVLLVLTVIVSVVGTWAVLDSLDSPPVVLNTGGSDGQVRLNIVSPDQAPEATIVEPVDGQVQMTIV